MRYTSGFLRTRDFAGASLEEDRARGPDPGYGLVGAGCLPALRAAMFAADGERPAPRLHPAIDVRSGAQLAQRAGFSDPVADGRSLTVRYSSLDRLVSDLRAQGLGNVLARPGPPLSRAAIDVAREVFGSANEETFEIITLTGWKR